MHSTSSWHSVSSGKGRLSARSLQFWVLAGFLVATFLLGGGARADIQSLLLLRPLAVVACGFALWTLRGEHVREHRALFALMAAAMALPLLHLVPLPAAVWQSLPGREIVVAVERAAGLESGWRPLSLVPAGSWNAFFSLFVPLAVLLLGVQLAPRERADLLPLLLALGLLSGLVGLLQAIGDPNSPLYLYRITNNGAAVGLFSNRNHQAILLAVLFPMLAVFASFGGVGEERGRLRLIAVVASAALLVPLLLVTGSRMGLLLSVFGIAAAALLYRKPDEPQRKRRGRSFDWRWPVAAGGLVALGAVTFLSSRAESLSRLAAPDQVDDLRFKVWGPIAASAWKYFPFGSGLGSFVEVHRIDEPDALLRPTYLNHAHNDWLELFLTSGLFGLVLAGAGVIWLAVRTGVAFRRAPNRRYDLMARLGAITIAMLLVASVFDYPLRTPSLAALMVVAALWLNDGAREERRG